MDMKNMPCVSGDEMDMVTVEGEIVKYIREQRHDFMNHIQVIWGYLQLKKPSEASRYIIQMNEELNCLGSLFKLGNPAFSLFLYNNIKKAYKMGLKVDIETDIECIDNNLSYNYYSQLHILDELFEEVIKSAVDREGKTIYIDVYSEGSVLNVVISNNYCDSYEEYLEEHPENISTCIGNLYQKLIEWGIGVSYTKNAGCITYKISFDCREA